MTTLTRGLAALLACTSLASPATAHDTHKRGKELFQPGLTAATPAASPARVPLYQGLGLSSGGASPFPVTTASPAAQAYFDQGLELAWAFNHAEARRAFQEAQRLDPALRHVLLGRGVRRSAPTSTTACTRRRSRPPHTAITRAHGAERQGDAQGAGADRGAGHGAMAPDAIADRTALDQAWADAMREVAKAYPDDPDVQALFADALMNLQPWDYWEADERTPKGNGAEIVATLERALASNPDHAAAIHLYIHAVEASARRSGPSPTPTGCAAPRGRRAISSTCRRISICRVGRYRDSLDINRDAVAADEAMPGADRRGREPDLPLRLLPAQRPLPARLGADGGLGRGRDRRGRQARTGHLRRGRAELAWVQAIKSRALQRPRSVQRARTRSWRCPTQATASRS